MCTSADQAFPSLGIERGRFEGCMMQDPNQGGKFVMVHLVEQPSYPNATLNAYGF